jgi:hypothetical protein
MQRGRGAIFMTQQYWLAVLAYVLPTFPLGYFWHLKTFSKAYEELKMYRDQVIIPMGLLSMIIQGLFFAWVFPKLFASANGWMSNAFWFFIIFGGLAWSFLVLPVAAKYRMTSVSRFIQLETAFTAIQFAIAGVLIALVYRGGA